MAVSGGSRLGCSALVLALGCARADKGREPPVAPAVTPASAPEKAASTRAVPALGDAGDARRGTPTVTRPDPAERQRDRERMVERQIEGRGVSDPRVLRAMRRVPRHRFVLSSHREVAYADGPLPIVGGQTISQPYIVAFMTEAAHVRPGARCLEIGTGSGYQAAVLAELCAETYSIEYLPEVAAFGRHNLEATGYLERNVHLRVGDGYAGWPEHAPFDAILVTAAPEQVPQPLLDQLGVGGKLVIPVGPETEGQVLELWTRLRPGRGRKSFSRRKLFGVRFVPFLGPRGR